MISITLNCTITKFSTHIVYYFKHNNKTYHFERFVKNETRNNQSKDTSAKKSLTDLKKTNPGKNNQGKHMSTPLILREQMVGLIW